MRTDTQKFLAGLSTDKTSRRSRNLARATWTFAIGGGSWVLLCVSGLMGEVSDYVFVTTSALAVVGVLVGAFYSRPRPRSAWSVMLTAFVLFALGGAVRMDLNTLGDLTQHRSILPDVFTFGGYVLTAVGVIILSRKNGRKLGLDGFIDATVAASAVMLIVWIYLVEPALMNQNVHLSMRLLLALYAPTSVFLFALTLNYAFGGKVKLSTASSKFLAAALGMVFIGDFLYMLADTRIATIPFHILDAPYSLAFLIFPLAAVHPSVNQIPPMEIEDPDPEPNWLRLVPISLALTFPPFIILTQQTLTSEDQVVVGVLVFVLSTLAVIKIFRALMAQKRARGTLKHRATHDDMTGLPNRAYAMEFLDLALEEARAKHGALSVMFFDLDRFKYVNDTLGHTFGDALIRAVGERLNGHLEPDQMIARLGGDEFVIALPGVNSEEAHVIGERLLELVAEPFRLRNSEVLTGATVGLAVFDGAVDVTGSALIEAADTALYEGKEHGRGKVTEYDYAMRQKVEKEARIEAALRTALESDQFSIAYQPLVGARGRKAVGAEALLRWNNPELGFISPLNFIPIAEETGLIIPIGRWVLRQACQEVAVWRRYIDKDLKVSVNVSARQLSEPSFVREVEEALQAAGIEGSALDIEITESLLVATLEQMSSALEKIRELGVSVSVDDFGTGYSSLSYLKKFPVNRVKIDKSFIDGVTSEDNGDRTLVGAIVSMSKGLNMQVVAEGVETEQQAKVLEQLDVDYLQGYLYSKPLTSSEVRSRFEELL